MSINISTTESLQYDFSTIRAATDNFSDVNMLGQGGFGPVYKVIKLTYCCMNLTCIVQILFPRTYIISELLEKNSSEKIVADSGQGDLEFKKRGFVGCQTSTRGNLVDSLGFCLDRTERLLVYEFVPNASLDHFLFDSVKRTQLDWERRSTIIRGVARGILYLYEDSRLQIIHRDLKASNVLLDEKMYPKISDFGMARLFKLGETQGNTSRIVGTYGYMAPEYAMHGQFSVKSDVFSFGVLVLEVLSGLKNTCFRNGESVEVLLSNTMGNTAMSLLKWLVILLFQFYYLFDLSIAQSNFTSSVCSTDSNITEFSPNSAYDTNLNTILSSVSRNMDSFGFYNSSIGLNSDTVSVIAQCRGDRWAFGYYDRCMLRYSNESIIGNVANQPGRVLSNGLNASSSDEFMGDLRTLLESLRSQASQGGKKKYASNSTQGPDFQTIYVLVQCTADLSAESCINCLSAGYQTLPRCACYGKRGVNFMMPSCNFRYEIYPFFDELSTQAPPPLPLLPPPSPLPPPPSGKDDKTTRTIIIIVVPTVIGVILIVCISVILMRRRRRKLVNDIQSIHGDDISTAESFQYDFSTIRAATDNFSSANKLGQGGFGPVYKGKLPNRQEVAVKRLSADSGQGDLEFKNEVMLVARLQHRNLVRLLGFCLDGTERLLVYEFVPNASLDQFLFDPVKRRKLDWERRSKIIGGVAKGILYLHEDSRLRIINRDLKASNVLLDEEMNPKIADFGMARLFTLDETQGNTSRIVGTYGYMAPEYAMHGQFSVKSDAWTNWQEGTATNLIDPMFRGSSGLVHDIMRYIHIALLCVQENIGDRPTMAAVVLMLSSLSLSLPVPSGPAYYTHDDISPEISLIK
ncbi:hypothetical protein H5410_008034, partial [Solanum commersonii]